VDLSSVFQAGPVLAACFGLLCVGLVCPAPVRGPLAKTGGVLTLFVAAAMLFYVGLGLASQAWTASPEYTWLAMVATMGLAFVVAQHRATRKHRVRDEDDEDDDGGQRLWVPDPPTPEFPGPGPVPSTDWGEFDSLREDWATPTREPVGV
jgi:hypothetical protein